MKMKSQRVINAMVLFLMLCLSGATVPAQDQARWFSAWTVSHHARETTPALSNSTLRMVVRPTVSGRSVRIKLENTVGQSPVTFSAAFIGVFDWDAWVVPGTNRKLTFRGGSGLTLAAGAGAWSDPMPFDVQAFQRLTVSLDVAAMSDVSTHTLGLASNYYAPGNHAVDFSGAAFTRVPPIAGSTRLVSFPFYWLSAVDVMSASAAGTIVAFGDSITDGRCSTTEHDGVVPDKYQRWTDVLAARLASSPQIEPRGVVNAAIVGNRVVTAGGNGPTAVERLERDVLERAGLTHVIFSEGTNDLAGGATAAQVTGGIREVVDRIRARNLRVIGATVIPRGRPEPMTGWTSDMEAQRLLLNAWIRTQAVFDAVLDFDRLLTGGPVYAGSQSIKPGFNCDYTHPNAAGYRAMGEFVDLALFTP